MQNPYEVLGVAPSATQDEIRRAFRKLAKTLHPDLNPGDAAAESRFKAVSAAHELLSDPDKRARFDRGEIDADGNERGPFRSGSAGGGPAWQDIDPAEAEAAFGDVFSELFGRGGNPFGGRGFGKGGFGGRRSMRLRGQDRLYRLAVDFVEAANGGVRRIDLPDGKTLDVRIPAGIRDGQTLRLAGQGDPGIGGGETGDALIEVHVAPHPLFRRVGDDVHVELPVTLGEAVLGGKVTVPTVAGAVAMTVPKGSNSGTVLRLKGRGIGGKGDQLVTLKLVLPEQPDEELAKLVAEWAPEHPYDPRAGIG